MNERFRIQLSKAEYIAGLDPLMRELGSHDTNRMPRIIEQLAAFLLVMAVIAVAFPEALLGAVVAAVLLGLLQSLLSRRWIRGATGLSYDPALADHDIELTDSGIVDRTAMRERRWDWTAVRRIHETTGAIVLELAGWDMVVLPARLWASTDERTALLHQLRERAVAAAPSDANRKPGPLGSQELLAIGALAAGVDALAVVVFTLPVHRGPGPPVGDAPFLGLFFGLILLGLVLAYVAYRIARRQLLRLHDRSPRLALAIAQAMIWAVPLYILLASFGWV